MSLRDSASSLCLAALDSGAWVRVAREVRDAKEWAERLGFVSATAMRSAMGRVRKTGRHVPSWDEARRGGEIIEAPLEVSTDRYAQNDNAPDFDSEEPTQPGNDNRPIRTVADDLAARRDKATIADLKARLSDALAELERCRLERDVAIGAEYARTEVPRIEPRDRTGTKREATAVALASDWHIEERVEPGLVNGVNSYDIDIARRRVGRFFSGFSTLIRYHQDHFAIRDALLWLGGDLITGHLREENLESNELSPVQAIATLHVWLADGIRHLLATANIDHLRIVCNSGNHGRLTDKVRPATREANSIEWLLYVGLSREFASDPRVTFVLPAGAHTYVQIYDYVIRFHHGDDVSFGGGVGGITIPIMKALARWDTVKRADLTCLGHFHQYVDLNGLVVNGSLIGYNPYALRIGARYEPPRQAFFLVDSKRGKTMPADIWVEEA